MNSFHLTPCFQHVFADVQVNNIKHCSLTWINSEKLGINTPTGVHEYTYLFGDLADVFIKKDKKEILLAFLPYPVRQVSPSRSFSWEAPTEDASQKAVIPQFTRPSGLIVLKLGLHKKDYAKVLEFMFAANMFQINPYEAFFWTTNGLSAKKKPKKYLKLPVVPQVRPPKWPQDMMGILLKGWIDVDY